jgi:hypothetical protein
VTLKSALMVNVRAFEVTPSGSPCDFTVGAGKAEAVNTVTAAVPAVAISAAVIAAVNCVEFTKVVARALPFH